MTIVDLHTGPRDRGLDAEERALLRRWAPHLVPALEAVVDAYHARLVEGAPHASPPDADVEHTRAVRLAHWRHLLEGDEDEVRAAHGERYGARRLDAGQSRAVFAIAAEFFVVGLLDRIDADPAIPVDVRPSLRRAVIRAAFFDLALAEAARDVVWID